MVKLLACKSPKSNTKWLIYLFIQIDQKANNLEFQVKMTFKTIVYNYQVRISPHICQTSCTRILQLKLKKKKKNELVQDYQRDAFPSSNGDY